MSVLDVGTVILNLNAGTSGWGVLRFVGEDDVDADNGWHVIALFLCEEDAKLFWRMHNTPESPHYLRRVEIPGGQVPVPLAQSQIKQSRGDA